jgi:DNA-binding MarR family transcriptional regulator
MTDGRQHPEIQAKVLAALVAIAAADDVPSVRAIAKRTGLSVRGVHGNLFRLELAGLAERRGTEGKRWWPTEPGKAKAAEQAAQPEAAAE